jgi:hypothetical protein
MHADWGPPSIYGGLQLLLLFFPIDTGDALDFSSSRYNHRSSLCSPRITARLVVLAFPQDFSITVGLYMLLCSRLVVLKVGSIGLCAHCCV